MAWTGDDSRIVTEGRSRCQTRLGTIGGAIEVEVALEKAPLAGERERRLDVRGVAIPGADGDVRHLEQAFAEAFARRLKSALAVPIRFKEHEIVTTASIGVALAPADGSSAERLLKSADLALTKVTKLTEQAEVEFGVQAFNIFNHVQLGDPGTLFLNYTPGQTPSNLSDPGNFGVITSIVNFNNNNDNAASPNTGTGLPRQLQLMVRVRF